MVLLRLAGLAQRGGEFLELVLEFAGLVDRLLLSPPPVHVSPSNVLSPLIASVPPLNFTPDDGRPAGLLIV